MKKEVSYIGIVILHILKISAVGKTLNIYFKDTIDRFPDEYDPLKPNDFNKFLKRRREGKHKISKYAHFKKSKFSGYI